MAAAGAGRRAAAASSAAGGLRLGRTASAAALGTRARAVTRITRHGIR